MFSDLLTFLFTNNPVGDTNAGCKLKYWKNQKWLYVLLK